MNRKIIYILVLTSCSSPKSKTMPGDSPVGMVWLAGGQFTMGSAKQCNTHDAQPFHNVKVDGFWMDETEVTNDQFAEFVKATHYVTLAERPVNWEELKKLVPPGTPKPPDDMLVPGSLVFSPPAEPVLLNDYRRWWAWVKGADWRHPSGPSSSLEGKGNHPVVQVAYEDAQAYAQWAGKRLPTEAEFEFAARGGLTAQEYAWGNQRNPEGKFLANYFQGSFPNHNTADDGFEGTAPVKSFPPNGYGLYDMVGNVWELCSDWYAAEDFESVRYPDLTMNPKGPSQTYDPNDALAVKHVSKGGSYLCSDMYCSNYKPSGRQGSAYDAGMSHTGFRCVKN